MSDLQQGVEERPRPTPPARPSPGRPRERRQLEAADVMCTAIGLVAAILVVIALRTGFGVDNTLAIGLAAYGAFVAGLVVAELARRPKRGPYPPTEPPPTLAEAEWLRAARAAAPPQTNDITATTPAVDALPPEQVLDARTEEVMPVGLPSDPANDRPNRRRAFTMRDLAEVFWAAVAAAAFAAVIRTIWGLTGPTGTFVWFFLAFLVAVYLLARERVGADAALDRVVTVLVWSAGALVIGVLGWMIGFLVIKGLPGLSAGFFTDDLSQVGPLTPGGGAYHAIVGTVEQVGAATIVVVPIAVLTAVYLHEMQGPLARPVRFIVDAMSGLPSIVAGLLVFTVLVNGSGYSGFKASIALIVLALPTVTRASEEILRTIPDSLREASLALGAPQWRVVMRVVLPTARTGLVTATLLGIARMVGETAPVILTALGSDSTNYNLFKGPQSDLPLFVWKLLRVPNAKQNERAWAGLLVLVLLVLVLFVAARFIASRNQRKLGRGR